jgi:hypothetical protein
MAKKIKYDQGKNKIVNQAPQPIEEILDINDARTLVSHMQSEIDAKSQELADLQGDLIDLQEAIAAYELKN